MIGSKVTHARSWGLAEVPLESVIAKMDGRIKLLRVSRGIHVKGMGKKYVK